MFSLPPREFLELLGGGCVSRRRGELSIYWGSFVSLCVLSNGCVDVVVCLGRGLGLSRMIGCAAGAIALSCAVGVSGTFALVGVGSASLLIDVAFRFFLGLLSVVLLFSSSSSISSYELVQQRTKQKTYLERVSFCRRPECI